LNFRFISLFLAISYSFASSPCYSHRFSAIQPPCSGKTHSTLNFYFPFTVHFGDFSVNLLFTCHFQFVLPRSVAFFIWPLSKSNLTNSQLTNKEKKMKKPRKISAKNPAEADRRAGEKKPTRKI